APSSTRSTASIWIERRGRPRSVFDPIDRAALAVLPCAMSAAVEAAVALDAVTDDSALAMRARRRERLDGALEAIEGVRRVTGVHFERFVVSVAAGVTRPGMLGPDGERDRRFDGSLLGSS